MKDFIVVLDDTARKLGCMIISLFVYCIPIIVYKFVTSGDDLLSCIGSIVGLITYLVLALWLVIITDDEKEINKTEGREEE